MTRDTISGRFLPDIVSPARAAPERSRFPRRKAITRKSYEIVFHRLARADLFDIYDYIERQSGPVRAGDYIHHIEEACNGLKDFPEKGMPRNDIAVAVRTWAIERRA